MELEPIFYLVRIGVNTYLALLNMVLIRSALTPKKRFSGVPLLLGTFAITMGQLILNMFLYEYIGLKMIVGILVLAFATGIFYRDKFSRRVGVGSTYILLVSLSEGLHGAFMAGIYGVSCMMTLEHGDIMLRSMPMLMLLYTFFFGGTSLIVWKRRRRGNLFHLDRFFILPLSQAVTVLAFLVSMYVDSGSVGIWDAAITLVILVLCVVTDIVFLRIVDAFIRQKQREEQQKLQKRHYAAMLEQQRSVRKMRHDIANHLMTIEAMVSQGDPEAEEYSRRLMEEVKKTQTVDRCENQIVDAVLYSKAVEASAADMDFQVEARLSEDVAIDELDLMSLLSNLLDNALTAAAQSERKQVSVKIREKAGAAVFQVRNTIAPHTVPDLQKTSKQDKMSHGLGIGIIKDICSRYNGTFTTALEEDWFEVSVMLLPVSKDV